MFSRNDLNGGFCNWMTCFSIYISTTTFDNYKKYIIANWGTDFSSKNTYWDYPFLSPMSIHSTSFLQLWRGVPFFFHSGSSRFFKWFSSMKYSSHNKNVKQLYFIFSASKQLAHAVHPTYFSMADFVIEWHVFLFIFPQQHLIITRNIL